MRPRAAHGMECCAIWQSEAYSHFRAGIRRDGGLAWADEALGVLQQLKFVKHASKLSDLRKIHAAVASTGKYFDVETSPGTWEYK